MDRPARRRVRRRAEGAVGNFLEAQQLRELVQNYHMNHEESSSSSDSDNRESDSSRGEDRSGDEDESGVENADNYDDNMDISDNEQGNDGNENINEGNENENGNENDIGNNDEVNNQEADAGPLNEREKEEFLVQTLREFGSSGGVLSMTKLDQLLQRLSGVFKSVPKSYKTLLSTPSNLNIMIGNGFKFWYKGIKANLDPLELERYLQLFGRIKININMDGLPLSKTGGSKLKFWPILGKLKHTENEPFIIAIYCGESDPRDIDVFLGDFTIELNDLHTDGYNYNGENFPCEAENFILDAPARSLVKCCVSHGGYGACEKCTVRGMYAEDRMNFAVVGPEVQLRTDQSFANQEDRIHHCGRSPLQMVHGIGLVSNFRLDTMHLVYKGAFLRLLDVLLTWEGPWNFTADTICAMSEKLLGFVASCPGDFNRKPRRIEEYYKYKATELRRLLLYDGAVVFQSQMDNNIYNLFCLLHCAIYILASPYLLPNFLDEAKVYLDNFVQYSAEIFGNHFVVYNIHSLTHLADECNIHGVIENFSAFCYENRLKSIKETLKSGYLPLEQIVRRDSERVNREIKIKSNQNNVQPLKQHYDPCEQENGNHYKKIKFVVVKFEGEEVPEVARYSWVRMKDDQFECKWPGGALTEKQLFTMITKPDVPTDGWEFHPCEILNSYDNYLDAHLGRKNRALNPDYETEKELGLGCRKRRPKRFHDDHVEVVDDGHKKKKLSIPNVPQDIPAPPKIVFKTRTTSQPSSSQSQGECPSHSVPTTAQIVIVPPKSKNSANLILQTKKTASVTSQPSSSQNQEECPSHSVPTTAPIVIVPPKSKNSTNLILQTKKTASVTSQPSSSQSQGECLSRSVPTTAPIAIAPPKSKNSVNITLQTKKTASVTRKNRGTNAQSIDDLKQIMKSASTSNTKTSTKNSLEDFDECSDDSDNFDGSDKSKDDDDTFISNSPVRIFSPCSILQSPLAQSPPAGHVSETSEPEDGHDVIPGSDFKSPDTANSTGRKCGSDEAFQMKVLTMLTELNQKTETCLATTSRIAMHVLPNEKAFTRPVGLPTLPLQTLSDVEKMEESLSESDDNVANLSMYLSSFVLKDSDKEKQSAFKVMEQLLWNCCAKHFSMTGRKGKKNFSALNLWRAVKGAISYKVEASDLSAAKEGVQSWLKYAEYRVQEDGLRSKQNIKRQSCSSSSKSEGEKDSKKHSSHMKRSHK